MKSQLCVCWPGYTASGKGTPTRKSSELKDEAANDNKDAERREVGGLSRRKKARKTDVGVDTTVTTSQARIVQSSPVNMGARKKTAKTEKRASEDSIITEVTSTVSYTVKTKRTYYDRDEQHPSSSRTTSSSRKISRTSRTNSLANSCDQTSKRRNRRCTRGSSASVVSKSGKSARLSRKGTRRKSGSLSNSSFGLTASKKRHRPRRASRSTSRNDKHQRSTSRSSSIPVKETYGNKKARSKMALSSSCRGKKHVAKRQRRFRETSISSGSSGTSDTESVSISSGDSSNTSSEWKLYNGWRSRSSTVSSSGCRSSANAVKREHRSTSSQSGTSDSRGKHMGGSERPLQMHKRCLSKRKSNVTRMTSGQQSPRNQSLRGSACHKRSTTKRRGAISRTSTTGVRKKRESRRPCRSRSNSSRPRNLFYKRTKRHRSPSTQSEVSSNESEWRALRQDASSRSDKSKARRKKRNLTKRHQSSTSISSSPRTAKRCMTRKRRWSNASSSPLTREADERSTKRLRLSERKTSASGHRHRRALTNRSSTATVLSKYRKENKRDSTCAHTKTKREANPTRRSRRMTLDRGALHKPTTRRNPGSSGSRKRRRSRSHSSASTAKDKGKKKKWSWISSRSSKSGGKHLSRKIRRSPSISSSSSSSSRSSSGRSTWGSHRAMRKRQKKSKIAKGTRKSEQIYCRSTSGKGLTMAEIFCTLPRRPPK